jgi:hypothetical protein
MRDFEIERLKLLFFKERKEVLYDFCGGFRGFGTFVSRGHRPGPIGCTPHGAEMTSEENAKDQTCSASPSYLIAQSQPYEHTQLLDGRTLYDKYTFAYFYFLIMIFHLCKIPPHTCLSYPTRKVLYTPRGSV